MTRVMMRKVLIQYEYSTQGETNPKLTMATRQKHFEVSNAIEELIELKQEDFDTLNDLQKSTINKLYKRRRESKHSLLK